jgi:plasmid stabilization system protein ParE
MKRRRPLTLLAAAERDIEKAVRRYDAHAPGLGAAFADHLDDIFRQIERRPKLYPMVVGPVRRAVVLGFPYSVFYRNLPRRINVIAILRSGPAPGRREPGLGRQPGML